MLARAAVSIGLEVNRPTSPEPLWLDDWFLWVGRSSQPCSAPAPFFPEVHEELTKSWMVPFTARSCSSASSVLTTLNGGAASELSGGSQAGLFSYTVEGFAQQFLHGVWKRGSRCSARLVGSRAQFNTAMRFSSPGNLPSSAAFSRLRWQPGTLLSCARRLLSSWQRMQSSRSLQPRWGTGSFQDADAQAHNQMHPAPGLVFSDRPEGCVLSCSDPSVTQTVPTVLRLRVGMAVQGPPLRACQHLHATRLWRGSGCGIFYSTPMSSRQNSEWPTDRERLGYIRNPRSLMRKRRRNVPMPQFRTIAGCLGLVLGSSAENLMSGCTYCPFIPVCTGSGSVVQNPLGKIHWRFLLKSEMIGASK